MWNGKNELIMKTLRYIITCALLLTAAQLSFAQIRIVTGTILDETSAPMPGVSVFVKGTHNGTVSDADGRYSIGASSDETLAFDFMGYEPQEHKIGNRSVIDISLVPSSQALDELVVVGYSVQKKVNITGSVSTVKYDELSKSRPLTNTEGLLKGASPGLYVHQNSGKPGGEGMDIKIRGIGTLNTSSPLVIVDGFESSMDNVDPADIQSVSVLKDAASCAIYGNRGANGVILVTTKQAGEGKFSIEYNGMCALQQPASYVKLISNYADYMLFMNESAENVGTAPIFSQTMIDIWREKESDPNGIAASGVPNYVAYPNTDWMKAMYKNSLYQKHSIQANGSGKRTKYLISLSYMDNPGIVDNTGAKKFSFRTNVSSWVTDYLEIGARAFGYRFQREVCDFDNSTTYMNRAVPGIYPYYDGKYGWMENSEQDSMSRNNLYFLNRANGQDLNHYMNGTAYLNVRLPWGLKYHASFNYIYSNSHGEFVRHKGNAWSFSRGEWAYRYEDKTLFSRNETVNDGMRWTFQTNLSWDKTFKDHHVTALVGFEAFEATSRSLYASKKNFATDILQQMDNIITPSKTTGDITDYATASVFGRATYDWKGRYMAEVNLRYDGTSRFAAKSRWGLFPSVSAGWRINEEEFMKNAAWLDNLKLRASWGKLGNSSIGNYAYQSYYGDGYMYPLGGALKSGMVSTLSNELLRWETTTTIDIGLEFAALKNRLTFEADWYDKYTDGILYAAPIIGAVGTKSAPLQNLCAVTNWGVEFSIGWKDSIGDFSYGISGNFTRNWNQVSTYKGAFEAGWVRGEDGVYSYQSNIGDVSTVVDATRRVVEGKMINEFQVLNVYNGSGTYFFPDGSVNPDGGPKDGMIRTERDMEWLKAMIASGATFLPNKDVAKNGIWYGDYIYDDINGDGVYGDQNDYVFQGKNQTPKIFYGFTISLGWKDIDFSANFNGAAGAAMYWRQAGFNCYSTEGQSTLPYKIAYDHYFYDPANPTDERTNLTSKHGRLTYNYGSEQNGGGVYSNLFLYSTNYLRLQNVTLGYTLPQKVSKRIGMQGLRIFLSGDNLYTFTKFPGFDPSSTSKSSGGLNPYTSMRQYTIGLNVKF